MQCEIILGKELGPVKLDSNIPLATLFSMNDFCSFSSLIFMQN